MDRGGEAIRKHRSSRVILLLPIALMSLGLLFIYLIGPQRANFLNAYGFNYDESYFFGRQLFTVIISIVVFFISFKAMDIYEWCKDKFNIEYAWMEWGMKNIAKIILVFGLLASVVLAISAALRLPLAKCELGACRWISMPGGFSIQPAEFLKLGLVAYMADFFVRKKKEGTLGEGRDFWLPFLTVMFVSLFFVVLLQQDLGTGIVLVAIIMSMLFASGVELKYFLVTCAILLSAGLASIVVSPHRMERVKTYVAVLFGAENDSEEADGENDADTYHIENALMAIGVGGLTGVGMGNSVQATGYLPESINDSVFAIMGETFGFAGSMAVVLVFVWLLIEMINVSDHLNMYKKLVVVGVFGWIFAHMIINIFAMTGITPLTGITLPFLSYGGTSMMILAVALGVVLRYSCYTSREVIKDEDFSSRRGIGRAYYTSRRRSS